MILTVHQWRRYDRYWQGRSAWGDLARTARTLSRLIWIHVPLKLVPVQVNSDGTSPEVDTHVAKRVMIEKRLALDLIEGYVRVRSPPSI